MDVVPQLYNAVTGSRYTFPLFTLFEFKGRFQGLAYDYIEGVKDVVGGVQEEREPGNDPGDDEDRLE